MLYTASHSGVWWKVDQGLILRRNPVFRPCYYFPAPRVGGIKRRCASDVCLSVAYIESKSRTERSRKTKIGSEVAHVTCDLDTTSGSKVNLQEAGAFCGGLPHSLLLLYGVIAVASIDFTPP